MSKKGIIASASTGGVLGYITGRLTSADVKALADKVLDLASAFLRQQGPYVAYSLVVATSFVVICFLLINKLIKVKEQEIHRLEAQLELFQKFLLADYESLRNRFSKET